MGETFLDILQVELFKQETTGYSLDTFSRIFELGHLLIEVLVG